MENLNKPENETANDNFLTELTSSADNTSSQPKEKSLEEIERDKLMSNLKEKEYYENKPAPKEEVVENEPVVDEAKPIEDSFENSIIASEKQEKVIETKDSGEPESINDNETQSAPSVEVETKPEEPKVEEKRVESKGVEILSPKEATELEKKNTVKPITVKENVEIADDLDKKLYQSNKDIIMKNAEADVADNSEEEFQNLDIKEINETIDNAYEDESAKKPSEEDKSSEKMEVSIVKESEIQSSETETNETESTSEQGGTTAEPPKKKDYQYYGGDGNINAFKIRSAKTAKVLRNMNVEDTTNIEAANIDLKTKQERQDIYLKTVLPTLQPTMAVVPFIISGTVITMSAFSWPDVRDICAIEDKLADLDPNAQDYTYEKNLLFIQKREKELEMFYKHIIRVSGYEMKPSYEDLFGKIISFPDFQQLFFAAYVASFHKNYAFEIPCPKCGTLNKREVNSKDLCFLLNNNININQLNHYIEHGSSLDASESSKVYQEFQKEKIVDLAKSTYRTKRTLPNSSFIYDLKIPTVLDALNTMKEMIVTFKDRDLSYTDPESGETVYIDSSFGLTKELIELRSYLYIKSLIVARVIGEDKENNKAQVSFVEFTEKPAIINSIYNLSPEDYRTFLNDENLNKLIRVTGIRHAINGGICTEPTCESEIGNIPVEPEPLFFTIARQEFV